MVTLTDNVPSRQSEAALPGLPEDSRISVVECSDDGLVLAIEAAGRRAGSIILFALLWNAISWTVAVVFVFAGRDENAPLAAGAFSLLFVAVGAGLATWAVRAALTRTLVLIEKDQAAVQTILPGRRTTRSVTLTPASFARLEEAYRENDRPVHRVVLAGEGDRLAFGTPLSKEEKDWLVRVINARIAPKLPAPEVPPPDPLTEIARLGRPAQAIAPTELPGDSPVTIDAETGDSLTFHVPLLPSGPARLVPAAIFSGLLLLVSAWGVLRGAALFAANGPGLGGMLSLMPPALFAVVVLSGLLCVLAGRITTTVNSEGVTVRWHLGAVGKSLRLPLASIEKVTVGVEGRRETFGSHVAVVVAGRQIVPLTNLHDARTDREVAGLVRWRLERLGRRLADE